MYKSAVYAFREWSPSVYTGPLRAHVVQPRRKIQNNGLRVELPDYAEKGRPESEIQEQLAIRRVPPRVVRLLQPPAYHP